MPAPQSEGQRAMHIVYESETLKLEAVHPVTASEGGGVLLSFAGIGHRMKEIDVQKPEFLGSGRNFDNIIFVYDQRRSWGNQIDLELMAAEILKIAGRNALFTIGNSMGGLLAITATKFLPVTRAVSFVPQYSVDPEIAPWDQRWRMYTRRITEFPMKPASYYFVPETEYFIFSNGRGIDGKHAELFPKAPNIHHLIFPTAGHALAAQLKADGDLDRCVQMSFAGDSDICCTLENYRVSPPSGAAPHPASAAPGSSGPGIRPQA